MEVLKLWTSGEMSEGFINEVEKNFYVATYNNQVIGAGMIDIETGKIDAIFIHPDHMRLGVGKAIIQFLEDIAPLATG